MPQPFKELADGRLVAYVTLRPECLHLEVLADALGDALTDLEAEVPEGYTVQSGRWRDDADAKRDRGTRVHLAVYFRKRRDKPQGRSNESNTADSV